MNTMQLINNVEFETLKIYELKAKELEGRHTYLINILDCR
jgi:hypothetical protein